MDIIVLMKQVVDLEQVRIKHDTREPILDGLPWLFGEFDKCALEGALRLKEAHGGTVKVIAQGHPKLKETIKEALAMGADEAVLITDPALEAPDTAGAARVLAAAIKASGPYDLIMAGAGSADEYTGQVPSRIAQELDLPQVGFVREIDLADGKLTAVRDLEQAHQVVEVETPALVTAVSELNEPRLPPLTAILRAARKPVSELGPADLNLDADALTPSLEQTSNLAPAQARKNVMFEAAPDEAAAELAKALRKEGMV